MDEKIEVVSVSAYVPKPMDEELEGVYKALLHEMDALQHQFNDTEDDAMLTILNSTLIRFTNVLVTYGDVAYNANRGQYVLHHYTGVDIFYPYKKE